MHRCCGLLVKSKHGTGTAEFKLPGCLLFSIEGDL